MWQTNYGKLYNFLTYKINVTFSIFIDMIERWSTFLDFHRQHIDASWIVFICFCGCIKLCSYLISKWKSVVSKLWKPKTNCEGGCKWKLFDILYCFKSPIWNLCELIIFHQYIVAHGNNWIDLQLPLSKKMGDPFNCLCFQLFGFLPTSWVLNINKFFLFSSFGKRNIFIWVLICIYIFVFVNSTLNFLEYVLMYLQNIHMIDVDTK